jgi:hypothetical protein
MDTPSHPLDDFFRKVGPFTGTQAIYRSFELSCVAAKSGGDWLLLCGKAVLTTDPPPSESRLSRLVDFDDLQVISGRLKPEDFAGLVDNLKEGWVVRGFHKSLNVRLMPEGPGNFVWQLSGVRPSGTNRWKNEIAVNGFGGTVSSLLYSPSWHDIDDRLRENKDNNFDGLNGLFKFLRLKTARDLLSVTFFGISAELPARFKAVDYNRKSRVLDVEVERVGRPTLKVEWTPPGGELITIQDPFPDAPDTGQCRYSIPAQDDSTEAKLLLSFAGLGVANTLQCSINRKSTLLQVAESFDPNQQRLNDRLFNETDPRANAFELAVARLLSTSGYAVLWFGRGSKDALPDIVAHWRSPIGEDYFILAECTHVDPIRKLTDLVNRRNRLSEECGVTADRWLTVVFSRDEAIPRDIDAATAHGVVLCGGNGLRDLVKQVTSGASPSELYEGLRKQQGSIPLPIPGLGY